MAALSCRWAFALAALVSATAPAMAGAQELAPPKQGLVIVWRSPAVPTMPAVTWSIAPGDGHVSAVRTEARALLERLTGESAVYRVVFPLRSVDPFGSVHESEPDRAAIEAFGRLDAGKTARIAARAVLIHTDPRNKEEMRTESATVTVLTVEKHEAIEVPAGRFETIVLRVEAEQAPDSPAVHRVYRRYWYAPALGWYVRYEIAMTGPSLNQRNEYVAAKITSEKRAERP
ncbi:MAG: hypothetical protein U1F37_14745 [Alphaproteobacteria bacterium]